MQGTAESALLQPVKHAAVPSLASIQTKGSGFTLNPKQVIKWTNACRMQGAAESALIQRYAAPEEVVELPSHCSACGSPSTARMYQTHIPFFKACHVLRVCTAFVPVLCAVHVIGKSQQISAASVVEFADVHALVATLNRKSHA